MDSLHERNKVLREPLNIDAPLFTISATLVAIGLLMIYSTTGVMAEAKYGNAFFYVQRQGIALIFGLLALYAALRIPLGLLRDYSAYLLPLCVFLLLLPLIPGIGDSSGGASRWADLGILRFQPGEVVKLLFIVFLAGYYARHEEELGKFRAGFFKPLILLGIIAVLYLAEPDFGSTVAVSTVAFAMALVAGVRLRYLVSLVGLAAVAFVTLIYASPYRMRRITSFLAPWEDPSGQGYQLIQSLIAVGSGEFFGSGLGNSQQKLFFLPAAHTDFIYAVIAEEFGFVGACSILLLFLLFLWRGIVIAQKVSRDTFLHVLAVGLCLLIVVPALLNLGVVIGLLPTKGMVLPLVGYGGSSLVSSLFIIGLLLAVSREGARGLRS